MTDEIRKLRLQLDSAVTHLKAADSHRVQLLVENDRQRHQIQAFREALAARTEERNKLQAEADIMRKANEERASECKVQRAQIERLVSANNELGQKLGNLRRLNGELAKENYGLRSEVADATLSHKQNDTEFKELQAERDALAGCNRQLIVQRDSLRESFKEVTEECSRLRKSVCALGDANVTLNNWRLYFLKQEDVYKTRIKNFVVENEQLKAELAKWRNLASTTGYCTVMDNLKAENGRLAAELAKWQTGHRTVAYVAAEGDALVMERDLLKTEVDRQRGVIRRLHEALDKHFNPGELMNNLTAEFNRAKQDLDYVRGCCEGQRKRIEDLQKFATEHREAAARFRSWLEYIHAASFAGTFAHEWSEQALKPGTTPPS